MEKKIIHQDSGVSTNSEIDLFSLPSTSFDEDSGSWSSYLPVGTLSQNAPIEFSISGTDEHLDLSKTLLHIQCEVVSANNTPIPSTAPINNFLHSLFDQVDFFIQDRQTTSSNSLYPYRAYFQTLLNYNQEAKSSFLATQLYYEDSPGAF